MVGGMVIEVADVKGRPEVLFVDCRDRSYTKDTRAIFVEKNAKSQHIEVGDQLWWQGRWAMWTPAKNYGKEHLKCGVGFDIQIPRVGFSGVEHPSRRKV